MLEIVKIERPDSITLKAKGRIDTNNAANLASALQESVSRTTNETIVLDCENLQYMSSVGLRLLLQTRKQVGEDRLKLVNVTDVVYDILNVTGFDSFLKVERLGIQ
jgi:anti-anti-sigma factor